MQKKYLVLILLAVVIIGGIFLTNKMYFNNDEVSYEIVSYEDAPDYVRELIDIEKETSSWNFEASDGQYVVLTPPKDEAVEISFVGEDQDYGYGVVYKYYYVTEASDNPTENIKIIKINNYNGRLRGVMTRGN